MKNSPECKVTGLREFAARRQRRIRISRFLDEILAGGFAPESVACWCDGAFAPELERRGLLAGFDTSDNEPEATR